MQVINPYDGVNWATQQKANFHCHGKQVTIDDVVYGSPDVSITHQELIDAYYGAGYKILAITNHTEDSETPAYPWSLFERDPATLGMLAVQGMELENGDTGSLFNNQGIPGNDVEQSITTVENKGGLAINYHIGRYTRTPAWYVDLFTRYRNTLIGVEVYNQGDRYPNDRKEWDLINALAIQSGIVAYGYSNDDTHGITQLFRNYQFVLSADITETNVRAAMIAGQTYFCYEPAGTGAAKAPKIQRIVTDDITHKIEITADSGTIAWITEGTITVSTGNTFDFTDFDKSFVRAEITNDYGVTCTQPFVIGEKFFNNTAEKEYVKTAWGWNEIDKTYTKTAWGWNEADSILTR